MNSSKPFHSNTDRILVLGRRSKTTKLTAVVILLLVALTQPVHGVDDSSSPPNIEVQASEILAKIQKGEPVGYDHITVKGDLNLSQSNLNTNIMSSIRISNSTFDGFVSLNNTILWGPIDLSYSKFSNDSYFIGTKFERGANFMKAVFKEDAYFQGANFNGIVRFLVRDAPLPRFFNSIIVGIGPFDGAATFWDANFNGLAHFDNTTFNNDAYFGKAIFRGQAYFDEATFKGVAYFWSVTFNQFAFFLGTKFSNEVWFSDVAFNGAYFYRGVFNGFANFENTTSNWEVGFSEASFNRNVNFLRAKFNGKTYLQNVTFKGYFLGWDDFKNSKNLICDPETYSKLIKNFKDHSQFDDADDCYYVYRKRAMSYFNILDVISWLSCGFGVRWTYTLCTGLSIVIIFGSIYSLKTQPRTKTIWNRLNRISSKGLFESLLFSLIILISAPADLYPYGPGKYEKFKNRNKFLVIFERILGWGLLILFINTLSRVMIRY